MSNLNYRYLPKSIIVTYEGEIYTADDTHPHWSAICLLAEAGDPACVRLFDLGEAIVDRFTQVTERISVEGREVLLDGEPLDVPYVDQLLDAVGDDDNDRVLAWAKFFEKLAANPNREVRSQLSRWMEATGADWEITEDGNFIGYRGLARGGVSSHQGTARVDGQLYENTNIPNPVGSIVTMPRTDVTFDPNVGCASGLHVGTFQYARNWQTGGGVVKIEVDPVNVVSVPIEAGNAKIRVCAFKVLEKVN